MGSLGGDITATFVNPAGLAFYKTGDVVISPYYRFGNNKSTYFNRKEKDNFSNFTLGTSGIVAGSGNNRKGHNVAISLAYTRSADFNNDILYRGANNQSSYSQKYLEEIGSEGDANRVASDFPFGTSLAFNTYWIDTVNGGTNGNFQFQSRAANLLASGLLQEHTIQNRGGINEFALGVGANVSDNFMWGATLGVPFLNYRRNATFTEADATDNPNNNFDFASFTENLETKGIGVNLKAGIIFKPQEFWRVGLAFHTPTIYSMTDHYSTFITTNTENYHGELTDYSTDYTDDAPSQFKYLMTTPYRAIASVSYVLREIEDVSKQKGFLTADIEYVHYKASAFHEDNESFNDSSTETYLKSLNRAIDNAYKGALNLRLGGELKFTTLMVRAGAAYYGNPYQNINGEKGNQLNLSGGLGYRNKGMFIDLTYVHALKKDVHVPYRLESAPYANANIKSNVGNVLMTLGFKF